MPGRRAMKGKEKCPRSAGGYGRPERPERAAYARVRRRPSESLTRTSLNATTPVIFQGGMPDQVVVRRNARKKLVHSAFANRAQAPVYELLTPDLQRKLEVIWVELPPGQSNEEAPFIHDTEEWGVLLSGRLEVHLGSETYTLNAGDSISFRGVVPHWYKNPGDEPAVSIWIVTPPSF